MPSKQRDLHLDSLKGILIALVLVGHFAPKQLDSFNLAAGTIRIPLFIIVSSILIAPFHTSLLKKRFALVLIPYAIYNSIPLLLAPFGVQLDSWEKQSSYTFIYPQVMLVSWYLPTIFTINILYSVFKRVTAKQSPFIQAIIAGSIALPFVLFPSIATNFKYSNVFIKATIMFCYLLPLIFSASWIYKKRASFKRHAVPLSLAAITIAYIIYFIQERPQPYETGEAYVHLALLIFPNTILGYICLTIIASATLLVFLKLPHFAIFSYIGKYTFPVYLFHYGIVYELFKFHIEIKEWLELSGTVSKAFSLGAYLAIYPTTIILCIAIARCLLSVSPLFKYFGMTGTPYFPKTTN